jgi:hypothetical protein
LSKVGTADRYIWLFGLASHSRGCLGERITSVRQFGVSKAQKYVSHTHGLGKVSTRMEIEHIRWCNDYFFNLSMGVLPFLDSFQQLLVFILSR